MACEYFLSWKVVQKTLPGLAESIKRWSLYYVLPSCIHSNEWSVFDTSEFQSLVNVWVGDGHIALHRDNTNSDVRGPVLRHIPDEKPMPVVVVPDVVEFLELLRIVDVVPRGRHVTTPLQHLLVFIALHSLAVVTLVVGSNTVVEVLAVVGAPFFNVVEQRGLNGVVILIFQSSKPRPLITCGRMIPRLRPISFKSATHLSSRFQRRVARRSRGTPSMTSTQSSWP